MNANKLYTPKQLGDQLGVSNETLRLWALQGILESTTTKGGHRRYIYNGSFDNIVKKESLDKEVSNPGRKIVYARVSSHKQKGDLKRQVASLNETFPDYEVIQDIGSGVNYKRPGLLKILEATFDRQLSEVVVAHRDRLTRFGFELFQYIFNKHGVTIRVLEDSVFKEPTRELADDLLAVITFFTARYYGSRKYKILQEDQNLPKRRANHFVQQMHRGVKVLFQQRSQYNKLKTSTQRKNCIEPCSHEETSDDS
jgi:predicted site-specific integrase-resolvase